MSEPAPEKPLSGVYARFVTLEPSRLIGLPSMCALCLDAIQRSRLCGGVVAVTRDGYGGAELRHEITSVDELISFWQRNVTVRDEAGYGLRMGVYAATIVSGTLVCAGHATAALERR